MFRSTPPVTCDLCGTRHKAHLPCPVWRDQEADVIPDAHTIALLEQNIINNIRAEQARRQAEAFGQFLHQQEFLTGVTEADRINFRHLASQFGCAGIRLD